MQDLRKDQVRIFNGTNRVLKNQNSVKNALVVGFGSTSSTILLLLQSRAERVSCVTRNSESGQEAFEQLSITGGIVELYGKISRKVLIDEMFLGFDKLAEVKSLPEVIFLCVPNQQYSDVIEKLYDKKILTKDQTIVAISSRLGCGLGITHTIDELFKRDKTNHMNSKDFTVVNFSMYYAVTKKLASHCYTKYQISEIKKKIYVGVSNIEQIKVVDMIQDMMDSIGVKLEFVNNLLNAEIYNINIYIHAQLLISDKVLKDLFNEKEDTYYKYMYNLEEEHGVVNTEACERIINSEKEINAIYKQLNLKPLNYLALECDYYNYGTKINKMVNEYLNLDLQSKVQLLKTVLTFEHFRGIKLERIKMVSYQNGEIMCRVPRLPKEDYIGIVLLVEISKLLNLDTPTLNNIRNCFENFVINFENSMNCKTDIDIHGIAQDAKKISKMVVEEADNITQIMLFDIRKLNSL